MSLQPKLYYEAPEETARIARAALPQGTSCISMMRLARSFRTRISFRSFHLRGNRLPPLFDWRSPRSCSSSKVCRIAGLPMLCVLARRATRIDPLVALRHD